MDLNLTLIMELGGMLQIWWSKMVHLLVKWTKSQLFLYWLPFLRLCLHYLKDTRSDLVYVCFCMDVLFFVHIPIYNYMAIEFDWNANFVYVHISNIHILNSFDWPFTFAGVKILKYIVILNIQFLFLFFYILTCIFFFI